MEMVKGELVPDPRSYRVITWLHKDLTYMCVDILAYIGKLHLNPYFLSLGVSIPAVIMAFREREREREDPNKSEMKENDNQYL